jgi:hypothetical protein
LSECDIGAFALREVANWTLGSVPAGTVFVLGTTTITYRLVDENGNVSEECDFTVTVIDDEAPVIECPVALTGEVDASCVYVFSPNLVEANVTDNCDVYGGLTIDYRVFGPDNSVSGYIENGDPFNFVVGISQIEWRVVDGAGNVATCLQAMTVSDATPPVITCPTIDPSYDNTFDLCGYIAQGTEFDATATDNCSGVVLTNNYNGQSSLGGVLLPVGTTTVVWTATDANGNTDACTIEIEVEDTQDPVFITCPPNVTLSLAPGGCNTVLTWSIPVAEDNCGILSIEETTLPNPLFGTQQGVGTYDIEYTATDLYGNEAVCTFTITVEDTQGPILACPSNAFVNTNVGCTYVSLAGQFDPILTIDNCPGIVLEHSLDGGTTWVVGPVPAGTVFALGTTTIQYRLTDNGNQFELCQFSVTVSDDDAPVITCPGGLTGEVDASCVYVFSPNLAEANVTDNCDVYGALTIDYRVLGPDNSVSAYFANGTSFNFAAGISQIEWRVVDGAGNVATCLQSMTVSDDEDPVITCPTIDPSYDNTFDLCGYIAQGTEFDATATDNCSGVVLTNNYNGQSSLGGVLLPVGTTTVVWTATDANGNTDACTIEIEVEDTQDPVFITCPPNVTLSLAPGGCNTVLTWSIPVAEDNCGILSIEETTLPNPLFGTQQGVGTYDIEYTATDLYGNEAVCTFTITVEDTQGPILACPSNAFVNTNVGCTYVSLAGQFDPILTIDNCPGIVLEHSLDGGTTWVVGPVPAGTVFALGTTTIQYRLTDNGNQFELCQFSVTVSDDDAPVITCPGGLTGEVDASCVYVFSPNLAEANVTDNCDVYGALTITYRVLGPEQQCECVLCEWYELQLCGGHQPDRVESGRWSGQCGYVFAVYDGER